MLIKNANLIDGKTNEIKLNIALIIKDGRIQKIIPDNISSKEGEDIIIDAQGGTILPGFFNLHSHIHRRHLSWLKNDNPLEPFRIVHPRVERLPIHDVLFFALKNAWTELFMGITTIRDAGSRDNIATILRNLFAGSLFNGPRIISSGKIISMTGGHEESISTRECDGPDEVRKATREQFKAGADWVKFCASGGLAGMPDKENPHMIEFTYDELKAGIDVAHRRFKKALAHAHATEAIKNAVRAGVDTIEHGMYLDDEAIEMMIKNKTALVPTVSGIYRYAKLEEESGNIDFSRMLMEEVVAPHKKSVKKAFKAGIKIGTGSDTLGNIVDEIEIFKEIGFSSMEAIQSATRVSAEILGLNEILGTIEVGKIADIIIVNGDPLQNLKCLRNVPYVIKNGELVNPSWCLNL